MPNIYINGKNNLLYGWRFDLNKSIKQQITKCLNLGLKYKSL